MAVIITRAGKGSPLTNGELDANFVNLNDGLTTTAAITGGTINGTTIGAITPSTGVFSELDVDNIQIDGNVISSTNANGNIALTPNGTGEVDITKVDIDSGVIDGTTIGGTAAAAGTFTTVTATDIQVTNLKANDGASAGSIANTTGAVTLGAAPTLSALTASKPVFTDASKVLTSSGTLGADQGGTGVANNAASTVTISGNFATTLTISGTTSLTLPTTGTLPTLAGAETLSSKRITPRVSSTTSGSALTPDISLFDQYVYTALAAALTINAPIGSPSNGDKLLFRFLDNGVAQTLTWNATFTAIGITIPTTTVASKTTYVGCVYNAAAARWDVLAVTTQL